MVQDNLVFIHATGKKYFLEVFMIGLFGIIFGIIGFILLGISISSLLDEGASKGKFAMLSGGITCLSIVGILVNHLVKNVAIQETKFNTSENRFEILESNGKFSWIPFLEIETIEYRKDYQTSNNRHVAIYYTVFFQKTDGAWVDIYWFLSEDHAIQLTKKLQEALKQKSESNFNNSYSEITKDLFTIDKTHLEKTIFKWKDRTSKFSSFAGYFLILSFLTTLVQLSVIMEISWIISVIVAVFTSIIFFVALYSLWKQITVREYIVELNLQEIVYGHNTVFGFRKKFSMNWKDFLCTQVNITRKSYEEPKLSREIWILSKTVNGRLQSLKRKGNENIFDIKDFFFILREIPMIEFPGFTIGEILTFEKVLDSVISDNRYIESG